MIDQPTTAMKDLMGWVRLHEYNIVQRVQVAIGHYRRHLQHLLGGKAMVVTGSRKEAVRWRLAMRRDITPVAPARRPVGLLQQGTTIPTTDPPCSPKPAWPSTRA